jgi:hypothetical protein
VKITTPKADTTLKRYRVTVVVEAEDEECACDVACDVIREHSEGDEDDVTVEALGEVATQYPAPEAWHEAMKVVDFDGWDTFAREIALDYEGDLLPAFVVSNGAIALRLPEGFSPPEIRQTPVRLDAPDMCAITELGEERDEDNPIALIGERWFQQRYIWLVQQLFGDVVWFRPVGAHDLVVARSADDARLLAIVMAYRCVPKGVAA